jgi:Zn-dependent peptidase ImmA (M78 family)
MSLSRAQITARVQGLLNRFEFREPPIPVERLARELGAQLRYEPFDGELSGLLFREEDKVIVGVNALHPKTRQRFTIAHELGHLILHERDDLHIDRNYRVRWRDEVASHGVDTVEIAANAFAAELLMPAAMLKHDLEGHTVDYEDDELVRQLADRYKVSLQAMIIRLTNLGLMGQVPDLPV